jgi:serine/threonine protein kinase
MWQLLDAVEYLHENMVIHRDLKLGNLFLSDTLELKLGDFGLATRLRDKVSTLRARGPQLRAHLEPAFRTKGRRRCAAPQTTSHPKFSTVA